MKKRLYYLLISLGLAILIIFAILLRNDRSQDGPPAQDVHPLVRDVRVIPASVAPVEDAGSTLQVLTDWAEIAKSVGIHGDTEKCADCHFKETAHPGKHLERHPTEIFGCVLCHGGNSQAAEKGAAHTSTPDFPFLTEYRTEAACGKCHTEPAVPDAPALSGGRFVLNRYGCVTCHNLPVEIPVARYAPHLDYIGGKVTRAWLHDWLNDPTAYLPESKMPKIEMTDAERDAIVEFLRGLHDDALLQPIDGTGNAENGKKLYIENECQTCHTIGGEGDPIGPALDRVGTKVNRLWLTAYLKNPVALHPTTKMPDYEFTPQQILDLTEYLLTNFSEGATPLDKPERLENIDAAKARNGFNLYIRKGCAQCHGITKYMGVDIAENLKAWDIQTTMRRIQAHRGKRLEVPPIDIDESDRDLMAVALSAIQRNDVYRKLTYKLKDGTLGEPDLFLQEFWQFPIPLQGEPPHYYNDTVSKLDPESCGTCHQKQLADWKSTRHAIAMSPGIWGQLLRQGAGFANSCQMCHAPLSEQTESLWSPEVEDYVGNPAFDRNLQSHGLTCAVCHVREHQRFGPPFSEKAAAASVFAEGHHGGAVVSRAYQDAAFCSACHQFEEGDFELNGKLLENTYTEWRESPHAKNGQTCQSCHMPDQKHQWRGIHDPETVRDALKLAIEVEYRGNRLDTQIRLTNVGAGHHLPTYVTPGIFVTVRLIDATGTPIPDTEQVRIIQRRVSLMPGDYREVFDTRIPAGGTWVYDYKTPHSKAAKALEVRIDVHPDHFYHGFFEDFRANSPEAQQYINEAFEITEKSPYHLMTEQFLLKR